MLNPPDQVGQCHATAQRNRRVKRREGADLGSSYPIHHQSLRHGTLISRPAGMWQITTPVGIAGWL